MKMNVAAALSFGIALSGPCAPYALATSFSSTGNDMIILIFGFKLRGTHEWCF
jgi:hypothetical protein